MRGRVHLVVCAAPPASAVSELVELLMADGWAVHVVPTLAALDWIDLPRLEALTGNPIVLGSRKPGEERRLPPPDLLIVAPATFNTINKWAAGVNDSAALGVLNGAFGLGVPVIVSPYAKESLAAHPRFGRNLEELADWGVRLTTRDGLRCDGSEARFDWRVIMDRVPSA